MRGLVFRLVATAIGRLDDGVSPRIASRCVHVSLLLLLLLLILLLLLLRVAVVDANVVVIALGDLLPSHFEVNT